MKKWEEIERCDQTTNSYLSIYCFYYICYISSCEAHSIDFYLHPFRSSFFFFYLLNHPLDHISVFSIYDNHENRKLEKKGNGKMSERKE